MDLNMVFILLILVFVVVSMILIFIIMGNTKGEKNETIEITKVIKELETNIIKEDNENFTKILKETNDSFVKINNEVLGGQKNLIEMINKSLNDLRDVNEKKLAEIQDANDKKLSAIEKNMNEKLDIALNDKIDKSFQGIGEQLKQLYKTTGELNSMSGDIEDLKKTLSNVKTRGVFGEKQLLSILENIMTKDQYREQFKIENEFVDFAIKIPDKNGNGEIYLPIDSKFPSDYYNKVVDASSTGNEDSLKNAIKDLKNAILEQAKSINKKYIKPPETTDFAIMFLPTEGLYSECLRIDGLAEKCQNDYRIILVGPTTITAIINSLSIGFRYLQVNEKSAEINKILQAIKAQYERFGEEISKAKDNIDKAADAVEKLEKRRGLINKSLNNISSIGVEEANNIIGIEEK